MIFLAIHYLTGRAVATSFDERDQAEWPPHPARVFSMLVAAHHEFGGDPPERAALEWLQQQPPPSLVASEAQRRAVPIHYVPVNDAVLPREGKQGVAGLSKTQLSQGMQLLPEHRLRQPRTFPTVIPDNATVYVCWPNDPPAGLRSALHTLAAAATRLGHSSSLVNARWVDEGPLPTWVPDANGSVTLRVPGEEQLAALEDAHARWLATGRRSRSPCRFVRYARAGMINEPPATGWTGRMLIRSLVPDERNRPNCRWLEGPATAAVAKALRDAMLKMAHQPVPEIISGHQTDGSPSQMPHVGCCPLPYVHPVQKNADGHLTGIAIIIPRQASPDEESAVLAALAGIERLVLGDQGAWCLTVPDAVRTTLQEKTWAGPSRWWASATPVVYDRFPMQSYGDEAENMVMDSCERAGFPRPDRVVLNPKSLLYGAPPAKYFPSFSKPGAPRRFHAHAWISFSKPIHGPLLIGAGRYRGMGLFFPVSESHSS